jgi:glucose/arabinose dehydrogenase
MKESTMGRARHRIATLACALALAAAGCGDDSGNNPGDGGSPGGDGGGPGDDDDGGSGDGGGGGDGIDCPDAGAPAAPECKPQKGTNLALEFVAGGFDQPIFVTSPPGDPRLFVVSKHGAISIVEDGKVRPTPFLDIDGRVTSAPADNEQGLLGLAFHPDYACNGRFFVFYTGRMSDQAQDILSEFRVDPDNPNRALADSERPILGVADPQGNHNGGMIAFGPDGYLYIGMGDGGNGGDTGTGHPPLGNGQDKTTLLGDILRIDIDVSDPPYYRVPPTNPYAEPKNGERREIFISGVRNPWRWSFDRQSGDLYIGDVGQGAWEEVSVLTPAQQSGANLGWREMEGMACYPPSSDDCNPANFTLPVEVYPNPGEGVGAAVVGGYVYRGSCFPDIQGWYFYGDYLTEQVWKFVFDGKGATESQEVTSDIDPDGVLSGLSSFGEDAFGELYVVSLRQGEIYRIVAGP